MGSNIKNRDAVHGHKWGCCEEVKKWADLLGKKCPLCKLDKKSSEPAKNADGTVRSNRGLENGASLQAGPPVLTNSSGQQERACIKEMKGEVWSVPTSTWALWHTRMHTHPSKHLLHTQHVQHT